MPEPRMERLLQNVKKQSRPIKKPQTRRRFTLITLLCCSVLYLGYSALPSYSNVSTEISKPPLHKPLPKIAPHQKTILYWNGMFDALDFDLGEGHVSKHCPPDSDNCYALSDRSLRQIESYDAILFHGINEELHENDLPTRRSPRQKYIFVALESPANRHISSRFDGFFNATATYQVDSDVVWSYSDVVRVNSSIGVGGDEKKEMRRILKGKSSVAAWYVSNCNTPGGREKYVAELEKYLPVDKFGSCYKWKASCPRSRDCFREEIEPKYFFYLAFENSLCQDYVTEKLFHALQYYVVPIVYGAANYTKFAPPKSYIDVRDFDSPQHLALHLLSLTKNLTKYEEYFDWKWHYQVISPTKRIICDLCRLTNANQTKSYNISKWYSSSRCKLGLR